MMPRRSSARSTISAAGWTGTPEVEIVVAAAGPREDVERAVSVRALVIRALDDPGVVGGAFEHRFVEPRVSLRLITWINRLRYRLTRNYYGDQGLFVRTAVFRALGGYRDLALMEDLDLSHASRCA